MRDTVGYYFDRFVPTPLRAGLSWIILGFVFAVLVASVAPMVLGDRSYVVRSGSMSPAVDTGDVVVVEPIAPTEANVGDIVTFEDDQGNLISHRARAIKEQGGQVLFTTQGDANTSRENWKAPADGQIGRIVYRVPKLGFAVVWIQTGVGRVVLLIGPALLLGASLLRRIWRAETGTGIADGV
jgi:signal peptidase